MAVPWVVDRGLDRLLAQINEAAPGRSKVSDGSIGDAAHQATTSDHNPEHPPPVGNPDYEVDARDFTQDPAHGADMGVVSESIRLSKDSRVSYVIFNRRIFSGPDGPQPWVWRTYTGTDPHTGHMHVSVRDATHDQTQDWKIGIDAVTLSTLQDAQVNNSEHYLQALIGMASNAENISNTVTTNNKVANSLAAAIRSLQADVLALKVMVSALSTGTGLGPEELKALVREVLQEQTYTVSPVTSPAP
jgi:hypothetical protein